MSHPSQPSIKTYLDRPRLTLQMPTIVRGFSPAWRFSRPKTAAYRQVSNVISPPNTSAVGAPSPGRRMAAASRPGRHLVAV